MVDSRGRLSRPIDFEASYAWRWLLGAFEDQQERASLGTQRVQVGIGQNMFQMPSIGINNRPPIGRVRRGTGRTSNSVLSTWYPRNPLCDITVVVWVTLIFGILNYQSVMCVASLVSLMMNKVVLLLTLAKFMALFCLSNFQLSL